MWEHEKAKHAEPPSLADALQFSDDELALNRDGQLSDRQRDDLLSVAHQIRSFELLVYLAAAIVAVLVILDGIRRGDTLSSRVVMLGVLGVIVYGLEMVIQRYTSRYRLDAQAERIATRQGQVLLDIRQSSNSANYMVSVSGEKFNVARDAFFAFKNGDPYVLYYAPRSRRLLSAEPLREG